MDRLDGMEIEEFIFITGHLKGMVEKHVAGYGRPARFVEQVVQDGTAGAINIARPYVEGPVLILFVDTLFEADLTLIHRLDTDGIIWVKEVEDYQRFGVVVTDDVGNMTRIVEKPSEPISKLANIGLYYMNDWELLFEGVEHTLAQPKNQGEWYLTDAFQYMIDHGAKIRTAAVGGWYDCGKMGTLLETNHHLLREGRSVPPEARDGVSVVDPVRVAERVDLVGSTIGPNVTIEEGAVVHGSELRHTIVGRGARVLDSKIAYSMIGDDAEMKNVTGSWLIAAPGEIAEAQ